LSLLVSLRPRLMADGTSASRSAVITDRLTAQLVGVVSIGVALAIQISILVYAWHVLPAARHVSFFLLSCALIAPVFAFGVHTLRRASKLGS
jgi:hypothetical protein